MRYRFLFEKIMRKKYILLTFILLGIILRLFFLLNRGDFWIDESILYDIAKYYISDIPSRLNTPNELETTIPLYPPLLYHVLLHLWMFIDSSEVYLRLFSFLFGILSLFMMWKLAKEFFDESIAIFSVFLMAISPLQIYFSVECKSYALFLFLSLCSFYYFLQFLKNSKNELFYIISTLLCIYTHYYGIFLILIENVIFFASFLKKREAPLTKWIISQISILTLFLPWIKIFHKQFTYRYPNFVFKFHPSSTLSEGLYALKKIFMELSSFYYMGFRPKRIDNYILIIFGIAFIIGLNSFRKNLGKLFILCAYFFLPLIIQIYISTEDSSPYFIFLTPVFYIILSGGLLFLKEKRNAFTSLVFLFFLFSMVIMNGISLQNFYGEQCRGDKKLKWGGLSNFISKSELENSIILLDRGKLIPLLNYYFEDKIDCIGFLSPKTHKTLQEYRNYVDECLDVLSRKYDYFWIIYSPYHKDRSNFTKASLTKYLSILNSKNFADLKVELYKSKKVNSFDVVKAEDSKFYEMIGLPIDIAPGETFTDEVNILNTCSYSFYLIAKCSEVKPFYCSMALAIDDKVVDKKLVGSSFMYIYKIDAFIKKGRYRIKIECEKDECRVKQNRKLVIKNIFLCQK
ncbi:MAG: hypothetical protein C0412_14925 [Flavobacterium sp.]|nr:hypothetical protein [Flavobacterium sp.]